MTNETKKASKYSNAPTFNRRNLLASSIGVVSLSPTACSASGILSKPSNTSNIPLELDTPLVSTDQVWLGPQYWANRYQDWKHDGEWIECLRGDADVEARTVALLTHEVITASKPSTFSVTLEALKDTGKEGFGGFLIGIGEGKLNYKASALAQRGSGKGGGIFAVVDANGKTHFRDHTSEKKPLEFKSLESQNDFKKSIGPLRLELKVIPVNENNVSLRLEAINTKGELVSASELNDFPSTRILGGTSLVSSTPTKTPGIRFRFKNIEAAGDGLLIDPSRSLGPIIGALYTLNKGTLKITAQCCPVNTTTTPTVSLQTKNNKEWHTLQTIEIGPGYAASFRIETWDSTQAQAYRLVYSEMPELPYEGVIRAEPLSTDKLKIALEGCVLSTQHSLEGEPINRVVPQERRFGRYEPENFNFPHTELVNSTLSHDPDIVVFSGDQYYEQNPTRPERGTPDQVLDTLYRWHQFMWSFEALTKDRPSILLIDDHDVLQGNLWGQNGRDAPNGEQNLGGYVFGAKFVQMVEHMQCSHNPDPYDPTPIANDIPVNYSAFTYGGVSFAIVEDRKFKTAPTQGLDLDVYIGELLGKRQEDFLEAWKDIDAGLPKVILTQSMWGCLQTSPDGKPLIDYDSNGYPLLPRRKATQLAKDAGAVLLSGDQHLASLVRLGVDSFDDGPIQFTSPAGGSFWQRWFEPQTKLENQIPGEPNTGDFRDAFNNPMRVLAVANPKISFKEFRKYNTGRSQAINDRALKSEGYGIVIVDPEKENFTFECWEWNKGISSRDGQFSGWPIVIPFDQV